MPRGTLLRLRDSHLFSKDSSYMRNNKSTGQKNVRCFPSCSEGGHKLKTRQPKTGKLRRELTLSSVLPTSSLHQTYWNRTHRQMHCLRNFKPSSKRTTCNETRWILSRLFVFRVCVSNSRVSQTPYPHEHAKGPTTRSRPCSSVFHSLH